VDSDEPATDADLDAARALVLAGKRFGSAEYTGAGERIGEAVLEHETAYVGGLPVLAAGPWAKPVPPVVNPSYFSPRAYADLAAVRPDSRWDDLAGTSRAVAQSLTGGPSLPPDWARVDSLAPSGDERFSAAATAIATPDNPIATSASTASPGSGLDAVRLAVRSAESCVLADRQLAAALWPLYRDHPGSATYSLEGAPTGGLSHPAAYVAAAAAAKAAEHPEEMHRLLDRAGDANAEHPTYYGSAWVALGRIMLTSSALGGCSG
jgi:endoglucanase